MLSIDECRKLIKDGEKYSDKEIAQIRNDLYALADLALDSMEEKVQLKDSPSSDTV